MAEMGDNLKIRKLKNDLILTLNESLLPVEVKRMIVEDINKTLTELADNEVRKEEDEMRKEKKDADNLCSNGNSDEQ